jgi:hypothetical protein
MTDDLTRQLEMNRETWAALRDAGVAEGQTLGVDAFFFTPDEASATALASDLASLGWRADVHASKQGLLKKRTVWSVQGSRGLAATGVNVFDRMVEELDGLAQRHGAEFDGWGAEAPD